MPGVKLWIPLLSRYNQELSASHRPLRINENASSSAKLHPPHVQGRGPFHAQVTRGMQDVAEEAPVVAEYLPLSQAIQVSTEMALDLVGSEYVDLGQGVHVWLPVSSLYFPGTHKAHGPPAGPVKPALHTQSCGPPLEPAGAKDAGVHAKQPLLFLLLYVSMLQLAQTDAVVAAIDVEYLPEEHRVQGNGPRLGLYLPPVIEPEHEQWYVDAEWRHNNEFSNMAVREQEKQTIKTRDLDREHTRRRFVERCSLHCKCSRWRRHLLQKL